MLDNKEGFFGKEKIQIKIEQLILQMLINV